MARFTCTARDRAGKTVTSDLEAPSRARLVAPISFDDGRDVIPFDAFERPDAIDIIGLVLDAFELLDDEPVTDVLWVRVISTSPDRRDSELGVHATTVEVDVASTST